MNRTFHPALLALSATLLAACGGGDSGTSGGGSSVSASSSASSSTSSTASLSSSVSSAASVPGAPAATVATAGNAQVTIGFTAPASNGGSAITGYAASCAASGGATLTGQGAAAATAVTVTGLTNGVTYSCTVKASNAIGSSAASNAVSATPGANAFKVEVWADNWFSLHAGNVFVGEDRVPVTQVKSFNSETFTFAATYPFDLNFIIKDYVQLDYLNGDTGLEYINNVGGTQQMGDGGFIMQLTDTDTGKLAAVSGTTFKCLVIHRAPANKSCASQQNPTTAANSCGLPTILAEPAGWKNSGFDTSAWSTATTYTTTQVGVKEGYFDIAWQPSARPMWSSDLQADNTLLCKTTVTRPP